jgi:BlaI family penicillinase repressor
MSPIRGSSPGLGGVPMSLPDLSRFEFECLKKLWARGEATIRSIHGDLEDPPTYSTVRKIVERLEEKGAVERVRLTGKAWVYRPRVSAASMIGKEVERLLDTVFDGMAGPLVAHLVDIDALSPKDLRAVEKRLERRKKKKKKKAKREDSE